jgi:hypothetical protein
VTAAELDALAEVMLRRKILAIKDGALEIHLAPAALVPPMPEASPRPVAPEPEADPRISAPWMAFRPPPAEPAKETQPKPVFDPTDPNAPIDDRALFGADLPSP